MPKYVLTGADGNLGSVAALHALEIARPDQKLVFTTYKADDIPTDLRDACKLKGVDIVEATYDDPEGLKVVFEGAEAVSMISTWLLGERRRRQASNVVDAAKTAGVRRICYTSFVGAGLGETVQREEEIPFLPRDHALIEGVIRRSGLEWSIQRNNLYVDNIAALFAQSWKFCGNRWLSNSHGMRGAYVAREDCGRVLAALLLGKGESNTVYAVTGPEAVPDREIFDWICQQTGYRAEFVDLSDDDLRKWWADRGLPQGLDGGSTDLPMKLCMDDLLCCGEMVARGFMADTSDAVEKLTGRKPLNYQQALLKYQGHFPKPE